MAKAPIIISNGGIVGILEEYMKEGLSMGNAFKKLYKEKDTYATEYTPRKKPSFTFWHLEGETPKEELIQ